MNKKLNDGVERVGRRGGKQRIYASSWFRLHSSRMSHEGSPDAVRSGNVVCVGSMYT